MHKNILLAPPRICFHKADALAVVVNKGVLVAPLRICFRNAALAVFVDNKTAPAVVVDKVAVLAPVAVGKDSVVAVDKDVDSLLLDQVGDTLHPYKPLIVSPVMVVV